MTELAHLGRTSAYPTSYDEGLLQPIPRAPARAELGIAGTPPFRGVDQWTAWEVSWLDPRGKPRVATADLTVSADSENLVESKSLKLYLNSLNAERFESPEAVGERVQLALAASTGGSVEVVLRTAPPTEDRAAPPPGDCIDDLDVAIETYSVDPSLLASDPGTVVEEALHSHLLGSRCPVTSQPDWASVMVRYRGPRIDRSGLLRYVVSFREHAGFHENCVERMWMDVKERTGAERLTVYARYTRRGGIDINPFRSDFEDAPPNRRAWRQ